MSAIEDLVTYRHCLERIDFLWPAYLSKRSQRLEQQRRHGFAAEKVAENILEDLFTEVLDWTVADLNNQLDYADIVLTKNGVKYLLLEVKRPAALAWNRSSGPRFSWTPDWGMMPRQGGVQEPLSLAVRGGR